jgi:hypothetical protein
MAMSAEQGYRAAAFVGTFTAVAGAALLLAPERTGPLIGVTNRTDARILGVADLVLVPGLLAGRPRWPWMVARAVTNLGMAAFTLRRGALPKRTRLFTVFLCLATAADTRAVLALRSRDPE